MSNDKEKDSILRKAFLDIVKGYSRSSLDGKALFIKHLNILDQDFLDDKYQAKLESFKKLGIEPEEEVLKRLDKDGTWTSADENQLAQQKDFVKNLEKTKKALVIPSQIEQVKERIEHANSEVEKIELKKRNLLNESAESFANRYLNDISIYYAFFSDPELSTPLYSQEEFDELDRKDIYKLVSIYNESSDKMSMDIIKSLALSGLFVNYFNVNENKGNELFRRPTIELSFYQLNLITYAKVFKSIFKNIPDIPEDMRDDPEKLLEFAESGHKLKEKLEELKKKNARSGQNRAQSVVGASKKDLEKMGMDPIESQSPMEFLKRKGKTSFSLLDGDFNV